MIDVYLEEVIMDTGEITSALVLYVEKLDMWLTTTYLGSYDQVQEIWAPIDHDLFNYTYLGQFK